MAKRAIIAAALLFGSMLAAHADTDIYDDITKQNRSDDLLHVDNAHCDDIYGAPQNGTRTSAQYKRCMLSRGWRFRTTQITNTTADGRLICRARILNMEDTGWALNHHDYVRLTLRVTPPHGRAYVVTISREISNHAPPHVGNTIRVTCDPANPEEVRAL